MKSTVGDIELELWAKEIPMACKNCIRLSMEGYYHDTIFHRIIQGFIAYGGDLKGTGGGRISYKITFLSTRFNCCGRDDNDSQFYFTLGSTSELQNKHTMFGKVTGETIYNMLKLTALVDENDMPLHAPIMIKAELMNNPLSDIIPRIIVQESEEVKTVQKLKQQENFNLLSFGEKAEEDEEESATLNKKFCGKSKSAHDHLTDPKLSS
ncbi:Peptidyl-prolyl cis-trans isomerase CWC27 like protein [Eufriesea mexicana]|uniref:Spliceosome-associated protein CWC27 homolog n=1 Tax=Eufriesea mexicana TaxID=516756 RepID=A0A310SBK4_9HYME|nr:Peptidyl-prolyl cis-trans isomerase CWC27 like protein [Eufriesea mexicana]